MRLNSMFMIMLRKCSVLLKNALFPNWQTDIIAMKKENAPKKTFHGTKIVRRGLMVAVFLNFIFMTAGQQTQAGGASSEVAGKSSSDADIKVDLEYGEYLASDCTSCHSLYVGRDRIVALAGLPKDYLVDALVAYRAGERDNDAMTTVAKSLTDTDIQAIAGYLSTLPGKVPE